MVAWDNRRCRVLRNKQPTVFDTSPATLTAISTESFNGFVRPVPEESATQASSLCLPRHLIALHAVHRTMAERGKLADISLFHGGFQTAVWIQRASRTQTFNGLWICIKTDISACGSRDFNFPINHPLCVTHLAHTPIPSYTQRKMSRMQRDTQASGPMRRITSRKDGIRL